MFLPVFLHQLSYTNSFRQCISETNLPILSVNLDAILSHFVYLYSITPLSTSPIFLFKFILLLFSSLFTQPSLCSLFQHEHFFFHVNLFTFDVYVSLTLDLTYLPTRLSILLSIYLSSTQKCCWARATFSSQPGEEGCGSGTCDPPHPPFRERAATLSLSLYEVRLVRKSIAVKRDSATFQLLEKVTFKRNGSRTRFLESLRGRSRSVWKDVLPVWLDLPKFYHFGEIF